MIVGRTRQRFHGSPYREMPPYPFDSEASDFLEIIRNQNRLLITGTTIVNDDSNSPTSDQYIAAQRDPEMAYTHRKVASVFTQTASSDLLDRMVMQAVAAGVKPRITGNQMVFLPDTWLRSDHVERRNIALLSAVNGLLHRKLGMAHLVDRNEFLYSVGPFSITLADISHPVDRYDQIIDPSETPAGYLVERGIMAQLRVGVLKGFHHLVGRVSPYYQHVTSTPYDAFMAMIKERDVTKVFKDLDIETCIRGYCARTAGQLAVSVVTGGGRREASDLGWITPANDPAHKTLSIETAGVLKTILAKPAKRAAEEVRVDVNGVTRYRLGVGEAGLRTLVVCPVDAARLPALQFDHEQRIQMLMGSIFRRDLQRATGLASVGDAMNIDANEITPCLAFDDANVPDANGATMLASTWSQEIPISAARLLRAGEATSIAAGVVVELMPAAGIAPFVAYICEGADDAPSWTFSAQPAKQLMNGGHPFGPGIPPRDIAPQAGQILAALASQYPEIDPHIPLEIEPVSLR